MSILDRLSRINKVPVSKKVITNVFNPVTGDTDETTTTTLLGNYIHYNTTGSTSVLTDKMRERVSSVLLVDNKVSILDSDQLVVNNQLYNVVYKDDVANLGEVINIYLEKVV